MEQEDALNTVPMATMQIILSENAGLIHRIVHLAGEMIGIIAVLSYVMETLTILMVIMRLGNVKQDVRMDHGLIIIQVIDFV